MSEKKDAPFQKVEEQPRKKRRAGAEEKRAGAEGAEANAEAHVPAASLLGLPLILQGEIGSWTRMSDLFFLRFISQKHGEAMFQAALKRLERVVVDIRDKAFWDKDPFEPRKFLCQQMLAKSRHFCREVHMTNVFGAVEMILNTIKILTNVQVIEFCNISVGGFAAHRAANHVWINLWDVLPTTSPKLTTFIYRESAFEAFLGVNEDADDYEVKKGKESLIQQLNHSPLEVLVLPNAVKFSREYLDKLMQTKHFHRLRHLEVVCPWVEALPDLCKTWQNQNMQHLELIWTSEDFSELKDQQRRLSLLATLVAACPKLLTCRLSLVTRLQRHT